MTEPKGRDMHLTNGSVSQIRNQTYVVVNRFDHTERATSTKAEFFTGMEVLTSNDDEVAFRKIW